MEFAVTPECLEPYIARLPFLKVSQQGVNRTVVGGFDLTEHLRCICKIYAIRACQDLNLHREAYPRADIGQEMRSYKADLLYFTQIYRYVDVTLETLPAVSHIGPAALQSVCQGRFTLCRILGTVRQIVRHLAATGQMVKFDALFRTLPPLLVKIEGIVAEAAHLVCQKHCARAEAVEGPLFLRRPSDFRNGKGAGVSLELEVFHRWHVFRPKVTLQAKQTGGIRETVGR